MEQFRRGRISADVDNVIEIVAWSGARTFCVIGQNVGDM